jgi:hypothetical protein
MFSNPFGDNSSQQQNPNRQQNQEVNQNNNMMGAMG